MAIMDYVFIIYQKIYFHYFSGYGSSTGNENGIPLGRKHIILESVNITAVNTGKYNFSFTGYLSKVGQSPVD